MTSPQHQVPSPSWHTTLSRASTPSWTSCKSCENQGSDIVGGMIATGDLQTAHQYGVSGAAMGASLGAVSGAIGGYMSAQKQGISPWTGKAIDPQPSIVLGRDMNNRVNPIARDLNAETISNDWNKATPDNFHGDRLAGKQFNQEWLSIKIEEGYHVYDIGSGNNPIGQNYGMELRYLQNYNNLTNVRVIVSYRYVRIIYYVP